LVVGKEKEYIMMKMVIKYMKEIIKMVFVMEKKYIMMKMEIKDMKEIIKMVFVKEKE